MTQSISKEAISQIFSEARSHRAWLNRKVSDETLKEVYEVLKWGPTSVNCCPMRLVFVQSEAGKQKLYPALKGNNTEHVRGAPVTAIVAYDQKFFDELPRLFPVMPVKGMFDSNPAYSEETAFRNGSLQGAYLMIAARALGLDIGPMSGFDNAAVDLAFFSGTSWKSNFLCNLGYGDASKLFPRGPRLSFEEACKIV